MGILSVKSSYSCRSVVAGSADCSVKMKSREIIINREGGWATSRDHKATFKYEGSCSLCPDLSIGMK